MPNTLWKTTVAIWTDFDPSDTPLHELALATMDGTAFCASEHHVAVADPAAELGWEAAGFFGDGEEDGEELFDVSAADQPAGTPPGTSRPGEDPERTRQIAALNLGNVDFGLLQRQRRLVQAVLDCPHVDQQQRDLAEGLWELLSQVMERSAEALGDEGQRIVYGEGS